MFPSVFGGRFSGLPLEELGHRGQIRKMKILRNLRYGMFRVFQLFYDSPGQRSANVLINRFL